MSKQKFWIINKPLGQTRKKEGGNSRDGMQYWRIKVSILMTNLESLDEIFRAFKILYIIYWCYICRVLLLSSNKPFRFLRYSVLLLYTSSATHLFSELPFFLYLHSPFHFCSAILFQWFSHFLILLCNWWATCNFFSLFLYHFFTNISQHDSFRILFFFFF